MPRFALRVAAARGRLRRCRSSTMSPALPASRRLASDPAALATRRTGFFSSLLAVLNGRGSLVERWRRINVFQAAACHQASRGLASAPACRKAADLKVFLKYSLDRGGFSGFPAASPPPRKVLKKLLGEESQLKPSGGHDSDIVALARQRTDVAPVLPAHWFAFNLVCGPGLAFREEVLL
jgi:hypothetical protein